MEEIKPFADIIGKNVWHVHRGIGSFLTMEFGLPKLEVREPKPKSILRTDVSNELLSRRRITVLGEWHLWLQCASWSLALEQKLEVNGNSSPVDVDERIQNLDGQKLEVLNLSDDAVTFEMKFDLGGLLKVYPDIDTPNSVLVALYGPNGFYQEILQSTTMKLELNQKIISP